MVTGLNLSIFNVQPLVSVSTLKLISRLVPLANSVDMLYLLLKFQILIFSNKYAG